MIDSCSEILPIKTLRTGLFLVTAAPVPTPAPIGAVPLVPGAVTPAPVTSLNDPDCFVMPKVCAAGRYRTYYTAFGKNYVCCRKCTGNTWSDGTYDVCQLCPPGQISINDHTNCAVPSPTVATTSAPVPTAPVPTVTTPKPTTIAPVPVTVPFVTPKPV